MTLNQRWIGVIIPRLSDLEEISTISRDLAEKRSPSMYGIEAAGKPPSELFDRKDGENALKQAKFVHEIAEKFIVEFFEADR